MTRFSKKARKYIAALVGVGVLIALRYFEVDIPGMPEIVRDLIVGMLTAEGVYQAANEPAAG